MKRRQFVGLMGGAAVMWPLAARTQQPALPVIGFLSSRSPGAATRFIDAFRQGLKETGFVEGRSVTIQYRFAEDQYERLPALAADLVGLRVAVLIAGGTVGPAQKATTAIPIVFTIGFDPVATGTVSSINHPDGNVTGISFYSGALNSKQIELLREIAPKSAEIGFLVNPTGSATAIKINDARTAASAVKLNFHVFNASTPFDLETSFATLGRLPNAAMLVSVDPFFDGRPDQLAALAARYKVPAVYTLRDYVEAGGLISYGASITDAYRQAGLYAGEILRGKKVSELPVQFPTKFELAINLKAAKALGLDLPPTLLATADQVIE
jgi:putative ABC transport system substrate-binding protein